MSNISLRTGFKTLLTLSTGGSVLSITYNTMDNKVYVATTQGIYTINEDSIVAEIKPTDAD